MKVKRDKRARPVCQLDNEGNIIAEFPTVKAAAETVNTSIAHISEACAGTRPSAVGFRWCYKRDYKRVLSKWKPGTFRNVSGVRQLDSVTGERIAEFASIKAASETLCPNGTPEQVKQTYWQIYRACKAPGSMGAGYKWEYKVKGG